jgi:hypothetical protein
VCLGWLILYLEDRVLNSMEFAKVFHGDLSIVLFPTPVGAPPSCSWPNVAPGTPARCSAVQCSGGQEQDRDKETASRATASRRNQRVGSRFSCWILGKSC